MTRRTRGHPLPVARSWPLPLAIGAISGEMLPLGHGSGKDQQMNSTLTIVAGALIAGGARNWSEVLLGALCWPLIYCVYVTIADRGRMLEQVKVQRLRGKASPRAAFYGAAGSSALLIVLAVASAGFALRAWVG